MMMTERSEERQNLQLGNGTFIVLVGRKESSNQKTAERKILWKRFVGLQVHGLVNGRVYRKDDFLIEIE